MHPPSLRQTTKPGRGKTSQDKLKGKKMLTLISIQEIPPTGEQTGVFTKVSIKTGKDEDGVDFKHLISGIALDATDSSGTKFLLEKTYNLNLPRGITAFRNDYFDWSGRKLSDYELSKFDADTLMNGKPVKLVLRHRKDGKKSVAVIDRFLRTIIPQAHS